MSEKYLTKKDSSYTKAGSKNLKFPLLFHLYISAILVDHRVIYWKFNAFILNLYYFGPNSITIMLGWSNVCY